MESRQESSRSQNIRVKMSVDQRSHSSAQEELSMPCGSWNENDCEVPKVSNAEFKRANLNGMEVAFSARNKMDPAIHLQ